MNLVLAKNNVVIIPLVMVLIGILSCNNGAPKKDVTVITDSTNEETFLKKSFFEKLTGTWQSEDGKNFERWVKKDDSTFQSVSYNLVGADTTWTEQVIIYPENNNWVFESTVKGQNDGLPVKFVSGIFTDSSVLFSNPTHNFPTDISYTIINDSTLNAFIIGTNKKGIKDTIPFNYNRHSR